MSERILGRGAELQQVGALLADETPAARALVLTGDAGVGKTTIWERGVTLAAERGLCVLAARPAEAEAALPFAGLGDLLDPVVDAVELPRPQRAALDRSPVLKPWASHCRRIAAEPWVQVSGETWPCIFCWIRSSPTACAASTARSRSSWVT